MTNDVDDRLSRRFDDTADQDDDASEDADEGDEQSSMSSSQSESDEEAQSSQNAQNVKKEWNVRSFYLNDDLNRDLSTAFKRLDLEFSEADANIQLKKTRHFYPLIVELGLERVEEMDVTEVQERLERTD